MKFDNLQEIINEWNREQFQSLGERLCIETDEDYPDSDARIYRTGPVDRSCHCGTATGLDSFPEQLIHPGSKEAMAVGAVLDEQTVGRDLPVAVAVGINYGQFYAGSPGAMLNAGTWRQTGMWKRLELVLKKLSGPCANGAFDEFLVPGSFHLVAVNYFPWITSSPWGDIEMNSIAEALVLRCWGFRHPEAAVADLIAKVGNPNAQSQPGALPFVVFHGANNAVPYLALGTMRELCGSIDTKFIFSDNLARPYQPANAVLLHPICGPSADKLVRTEDD